MYIFLDEAGDFKKDKEPYFIVGGFITNNPRRTTKAFRKWQHTKFPKKIRRKSEVKFTDSGLNEKFRLKTLNYLVKQDLRIFYVYLDKNNIPLEYRTKKGIETGLLYTQIVSEALELVLPTVEKEFRVFLDKRPLKGISSGQFKGLLKVKLLPHLPKGTLLQIETVDSATHPNIQIADWICGALFRFYNKRTNNEEYFKALKNSIIGEKELFPKYWEEVFKNKKPR